MLAQAEIQQMPYPEKLALLEALWTEIAARPDKLEIPDWHKKILDARMRSAKRGSETLIDWETAKKQIQKTIQ